MRADLRIVVVQKDSSSLMNIKSEIRSLDQELLQQICFFSQPRQAIKEIDQRLMRHPLIVISSGYYDQPSSKGSLERIWANRFADQVKLHHPRTLFWLHSVMSELEFPTADYHNLDLVVPKVAGGAVSGSPHGLLAELLASASDFWDLSGLCDVFSEVRLPSRTLLQASA